MLILSAIVRLLRELLSGHHELLLQILEIRDVLLLRHGLLLLDGLVRLLLVLLLRRLGVVSGLFMAREGGVSVPVVVTVTGSAALLLAVLLTILAVIRAVLLAILAVIWAIIAILIWALTAVSITSP